jgi:hypothetical protein
MVSGATLTPQIDLRRGWKKVYLDPTSATAEVRLQAAVTSSGTYRQVYHPPINSTTVAHNIFKIPSTTSGGMTEIPAGLRFLKVETLTAVADGVTFTLVCSD